jgi:hypothetical protein
LPRIFTISSALPGTDPATAGKQGAFNQRRIAVTTAANLRRAAVQQGRDFNAKAVNHLKMFLGRFWNMLWQSIGFTNGSIALPYDPMPLLLKLRPHLIANPTHELAAEGITAANANALAIAINAASNAESTAVAARDVARDARDASASKLRARPGWPAFRTRATARRRRPSLAPLRVHSADRSPHSRDHRRPHPSPGWHPW